MPEEKWLPNFIQNCLRELSDNAKVFCSQLFFALSVKVAAPRFARQGNSVSFICSMETTHDDSSRILIDWFRAPIGQGYPLPHNLIESQPWNNISVYKEILGEARDGLRLEAVMQIHACDLQHTAIYECRAHEMHIDKRSRAYDSVSFEFTGGLICVLSLDAFFPFWTSKP